MHDTLPPLRVTAFPPLRRWSLATLQVNLGYRCNQSCVHRHVNAGPGRMEQVDEATIALIPRVLAARGLPALDLTCALAAPWPPCSATGSSSATASASRRSTGE